MAIQHPTYAAPRADLGAAIQEFELNGLVATEVLPLLNVPKREATMSVVTRENNTLEEIQHESGSAFTRANLTTEDKSYRTEDYGVEIALPDTDRSFFMSDYDAEMESVRKIRRLQLIAREKRVADAIFNTSTWTGADLYTDNSGSPWDNVATSTITQVEAAIEKVRANTGMMPTDILIGAKQLANLRKNTEIKAQFPGSAVMSRDVVLGNLSAIWGVNVIVGGGVYNSANEGQTWSATDIWSDDYAMVFVRHQGGSPASSAGLGRILNWQELASGDLNVLQYREEQTESDVFRVRLFEKSFIFDAYFGHLMKIDA